MRKITTLSVVIPVYNEEECISDSIRGIIREAAAYIDDFEVIAVDDNSSDATPDILRDLASREKRLRVVNNRGKRGLGNALRSGFRHAAKEAILYTDADMPCDLGQLRKAISLMEEEGADIVSAYRLNNKQGGLRRYIYSAAFNLIISAFFHPGVRDINFSFKLFRKEPLDALRLASQGSFINAELFIKASRNNYKIVQFPSRFLVRQKGKSKLDNIGNIAGIIRELAVFLCKGGESSPAESDQ